MGKINVTIWNEFRHEKNKPAVRAIYPDGIHRALADHLAAADLVIRCVSLDEPAQGLPDDLLNATDVLMWWGHCAQEHTNRCGCESQSKLGYYGQALRRWGCNWRW